MMILPCGKNDDASFGRNDEMSSANVPKALIILPFFCPAAGVKKFLDIHKCL